MQHDAIRKHNQQAWDRRVLRGDCQWTQPVSSEAIARARQGDLELYLTPTRRVPLHWYPPLAACPTLCLAGGGGQQGPLLAAAGARVTVLDNSPAQLAQDALVAQREDLELALLAGDMSDLSAFPDESFAFIVHPVSNLFVPDVRTVWREAARVLQPGGVLLAGFNHPVIYLFDDEEEVVNRRLLVAHRLPYSPFNADARSEGELCLAQGEPLEFGHSLEDQLGGQLAAGLVITGLYEDNNRPHSAGLLDEYMPIYLATQARKWVSWPAGS